MFARMTILQVLPETSEAAIRLFRRSVVPEAKKQKGYAGACLLSDAKSGKAIAVTFWRRESDALANEASRYYQEQLVKFLQYFSGPPIREGYTVSVHAMGDLESPGPRPAPRAASLKKAGRGRGTRAFGPSSPRPGLKRRPG